MTVGNPSCASKAAMSIVSDGFMACSKRCSLSVWNLGGQADAYLFVYIYIHIKGMGHGVYMATYA